MRIPRLAFAVLIAGILALASALAVEKVRARDTGTVVLLNTTGPDGLNLDCSLSTQDKDKYQSQYGCAAYATVGRQILGYQVGLLSRNGGRVLLAIRTRTYPIATRIFGAFELDKEIAKEVWFEPGEPLRLDVPEVGTLTLKGEWLDHMPIFMGAQKQDLSAGPGDLRFASPLLLKDKSVAGDLLGSAFGGVRTDDRNVSVNTAVFGYIPGEGSFLLSLLPIEGAVEAHVNFSRISFEEGGHSWEFVTGAPVSRAKKIWVLHQPDFKPEYRPDSVSVGTYVLRQVQPGVWAPSDMTN